MPSKAAENSFNAVRLLAALQVAYVHAVIHLQLPPLPGHQWILQFPGVPIFFAISGYLVFDSLLRLPTVWAFYRHRIARIYPALLVNIVILETLFWLGGGLHFGSAGPVKSILYEAFYMLTASDELAIRWSGARDIRSYDGFFSIYPSGVLWTLTVELTFYISIPMFLFARTRKVLASVLIVVFGIISIASNDLAQKSLLLALCSVPYFWMFGIGMLFRLWRPPQWSILPGAAIAFAAFILVALSRDLSWFEWKTSPAVSALIQGAMLCLIALFLGSSPALKSTTLAKFDVSYGLYLYHMLIVATLLNVPLADRTQGLILVVLMGGLLAGLLSWRLVERPTMKVARQQIILPA